MTDEPATARGSGGGHGMTVRGAAFLGIGSMVGAGIFALLGEAGAVAGAAVWISFLIAGAIAMLQGYAVAKLGATYPSSGGLVTFLLKAFGSGHLTAVTSWLLYFASLIVTAMVAVSFGNYGAALFAGPDADPLVSRLLIIGVVILVCVINIAGARFIDRIQSAIVIILLAVFVVFIVVTLATIDVSLLAPSTYPPASDVIGSVALTFFAFLGFAVISFTGGDLPDPARSLPRAMFIALGVTTALYVLVSIGVFGTLPVEEVIRHGDTALAEAVRPVLGDAGFALMAVAALLATSSSVTANLYAAVGSTAKLAEETTFPPIFGQRARIGSTRGLVISAILVLALALLVDLSAIASLGSAVALGIFLITSFAALRLRHQTESSLAMIMVGILATAGVLILFLVQTVQTEPVTFVAIVAILLLAVLLDQIWSRIRERRRARTAG
ncbi:MAG TPA: APC family permease [Microlunatus sp.]